MDNGQGSSRRMASGDRILPPNGDREVIDLTGPDAPSTTTFAAPIGNRKVIDLTGPDASTTTFPPPPAALLSPPIPRPFLVNTSGQVLIYPNPPIHDPSLEHPEPAYPFRSVVPWEQHSQAQNFAPSAAGPSATFEDLHVTQGNTPSMASATADRRYSNPGITAQDIVQPSEDYISTYYRRGSSSFVSMRDLHFDLSAIQNSRIETDDPYNSFFTANGVTPPSNESLARLFEKYRG